MTFHLPLVLMWSVGEAIASLPDTRSHSFTPRYDFTELGYRISVIATLRPDKMWFESQQEQQIRLSSKMSIWLWGLPSHVFSRYWYFLQRLKRPKREVDLTRSSSNEVKNGWSCTSVPLLCLLGANKNTFFIFYIQAERLNNLHSANKVYFCFWTNPGKNKSDYFPLQH